MLILELESGGQNVAEGAVGFEIHEEAHGETRQRGFGDALAEVVLLELDELVDEDGQAFVGRWIGLDVLLAVLGQPDADGLELRDGFGRFEELVVGTTVLLADNRHGCCWWW